MNRDTLLHQLNTLILPFWLKQQDNIHGGFIGKVDGNLVADSTFDKSGVMHSRYLWAFSASYRVLHDESLKKAANHAFDFILNTFWDEENGGIYWAVTADGTPSNPIKHLYAQSFAIYGLSEYYHACGDPNALNLAIKLFQLLESKSFRAELGGYHEEFSKNWEPRSSSEVTANIDTIRFTTNTHLHLLEAYSNLYEVWPDSQLKEKIIFLQTLFVEKIYHPDGYFGQYFDTDWQSLVPGLSYGHDIESSWLLDRSLEILDIKNSELSDITASVANYQLNHGLDHYSIMNNQTDFNTSDEIKVWWVQAEALIGFYNAYEKTGNSDYFKTVQTIWKYVQTHFIDSRLESEWFGYLTDNKPLMTNISDNWKGPYHTVRMYLELLSRMEEP